MTRGKSMRAARERKGFSVYELADMAGVTPLTVYRLESDKIGGTLATVERLADVLDLSIDEYVGHGVKCHD